MQTSSGRGGRNSDARTRREPSFDSGRDSRREGEDFRLRPEDRLPKAAAKPQPGKTVAERAARKPSGKSKGRGKSRSRQEGRQRRSLARRLVVWSFTLCIWGMIGF